MSPKFLLGLGVLTIAVGSAVSEGSSSIDISAYRKWTKVNASPIYMEPMVAALCVPTPAKWNSTNPHVPRYFTVYVNDIGKRAMLSGGKFPVGSIIVKEKFAPKMPYKEAASFDASKTTPKDFKHPELLTVMIKRAKGFNSKAGDWEFRTARTSKQLDSGDISHCVTCHLQVAETDYAFRTYVKKNR